MSKETRFVTVYSEGSFFARDGQHKILVDLETGVNYLMWRCGNAGSITPLLDSDGKPLVSAIPSV